MKKIPVSIFIIFLLNIVVFSVNFSEIRGLIIDAETLEPVTGVKVIINTEEKYSDHRGVFYIDSLLSGENMVILEHSQYDNFTQVVHLYKGLNTRKFFIKKRFNSAPEKKITKNVENQEPAPIKPEISAPQKNYWDQLLINEKESDFPDVCKDEIFNKEKNEDFFTEVRNIIGRLEGKMFLRGRVLNSSSMEPMRNFPVIIENEIKLTDKEGFFEIYSNNNRVNFLIESEDVLPLNKVITLTSTKNYVEILCEKISEDL
ncbi:MAG: hypothetical protein WC002_06430 [Candidatus Muiribacteriota bacterium]